MDLEKIIAWLYHYILLMQTFQHSKEPQSSQELVFLDQHWVDPDVSGNELLQLVWLA
jgi:hypothetical protein